MPSQDFLVIKFDDIDPLFRLEWLKISTIETRRFIRIFEKNLEYEIGILKIIPTKRT